MNRFLEESIISTIKSISACQEIAVEFDLDNIDFSAINQDFFLLNSEPSPYKKISLPKLNNQSEERIALVRAVADLSALYLAFHNLKMHQQYSFEDTKYSNLFDNLEKFRLIVKGSRIFQGLKFNLIKLIENNLDCFVDQISFLPLFLLRELSINSQEINNYLAIYKNSLSAELEVKIDELSRFIDNQENFAKISKEIIDLIKKDQNQEKKLNNQKDQQSSEILNHDLQEDQVPTGEQENKKENIIESDKKENTKDNSKSSDLGYNDSSEEVEKEKLLDKQTSIKFIPEYQIFTKKYDRIVKAKDLANSDELSYLGNQLNIKLKKIGKTSSRLTSKLKRKLLSKKNISYEYNKEEGIIDRKKISQLITKPSAKSNYVTINQDDYQNTIVCLLLDNSGSMRGAPIVMSAGACEVMAKVLERFAIKTEILGFTTSDWRGGKSRKLWEASGKPRNPGRLNDLLHIIYKNSQSSFKKSRANLSLMLKEGILKENIDGEALIWATERLLSKSEKRKILIVISDGTPIDDSTNSNNDSSILSDHLHQVISRIEKHSKIEVAAIGIGHDVGNFYRNSITIDNLEDLGDVMIDKICDLL